MKAILIILVMIMVVPTIEANPIDKRNSHDQKYTLKKRKKAGGTYNKRKEAKKKVKTCFKLAGIKYCKD